MRTHSEDSLRPSLMQCAAAGCKRCLLSTSRRKSIPTKGSRSATTCQTRQKRRTKTRRRKLAMFENAFVLRRCENRKWLCVDDDQSKKRKIHIFSSVETSRGGGKE